MNKTGPKRMMREPSKMAPKESNEQLHSKFKRGLNKEWFHSPSQSAPNILKNQAPHRALIE